jgi:anti-sigma regulatory factor (Ser/Thr protein kinase)
VSDLYIPNSVALRNFDSIFKNNQFDFSDGNVNISFHPRYVAMHPVGLAFYAALNDRFLSTNVETTATIDFKIRSIPYLQRMGLFSALGYNDPIPTDQHEEAGRFIPLRRIMTGDDLSTLIKDISPILHTSPETSRSVKHVFSELLRNVLEHSRAEYGGHVCATYNKNRKKISIGISDAGRGILKAMRGYKKFSSHLEAILHALTPGISGTTKRLGGTSENAGAGLFFTKCIAQSTRNHFLIYSGDSYFKLLTTPAGETITFNSDPRNDKANCKDGLPFFQGTLVGIDMYIEDTSAFNKLIDRIGDSYRLSVNRMKKDYYSKIRFT